MAVIFTSSFTNASAISAGADWSPTESELTQRNVSKYGPFNELEITNNSSNDNIHLVLDGDRNGQTEIVLGSVTKVFKKSDGNQFGRPRVANKDGSASVAAGDILVTLRKVL